MEPLLCVASSYLLVTSVSVWSHYCVLPQVTCFYISISMEPLLCVASSYLLVTSVWSHYCVLPQVTCFYISISMEPLLCVASSYLLVNLINLMDHLHDAVKSDQGTSKACLVWTVIPITTCIVVAWMINCVL